MDKYVAFISVKDGELDEILHDLQEARRTIYNCYEKLGKLGVLKIEKSDSDN